MAELEVPPRCPRWRHDLRPLDAHPEAAAGGRRPVFDRRLEGRRPHRRWRALRRGRGRRQGQAERGRHARAGAGTGDLAGGVRERPETSPPQIASLQWSASRAATRGRSSRRVGQTGTRGGTFAAKTAPALVRVWSAGRRARAASGSHPRDRSRSGGGRSPSRPPAAVRQVEGSGHRPAPLARDELGRGFQRLQVLDHPPRELRRG